MDLLCIGSVELLLLLRSAEAASDLADGIFGLSLSFCGFNLGHERACVELCWEGSLKGPCSIFFWLTNASDGRGFNGDAGLLTKCLDVITVTIVLR